MSILTAFLISLFREWNEIYTLKDCLRASTFKSNYYITGLRKGWSCKDWDELKFICRLLTWKTGGSIFQIKNIYSYNTQICHVISCSYAFVTSEQGLIYDMTHQYLSQLTPAGNGQTSHHFHFWNWRLRHQ